MGLFSFSKKKEEEVQSAEPTASDSPEESSKKQESMAMSGNVAQDLVKISSEIEKINLNIEAFKEVRSSFSERSNHMTEQIGELRAMIMDRDRTIQEIELKAIKAADLVQSVEPEKLMGEVQRQDVKVEALKANLEGNEAILSQVMDELKEARRKLEFFSGIEEIIKLSEDVKKELIEIKKVEGKIESSADKVETIYSEMRKRVQNLDNVEITLQENKANSEQNSKDIDFLKSKVSGLVEKEELDKLVSRFQKYVDALKELEKKSSLSKDLDELKIMLDGLK